LFKLAAISAHNLGEGAVKLTSILYVPSFWLALLLYGLATLLWIYLLQFVPLSKAYPFAALGFVFVPALAVVIFGERVTASYVVGVAFVVVGIVISSRS
jgi:drug/metabolite transporter (DMT)-like permease